MLSAPAAELKRILAIFGVTRPNEWLDDVSHRMIEASKKPCPTLKELGQQPVFGMRDKRPSDHAAQVLAEATWRSDDFKKLNYSDGCTTLAEMFMKNVQSRTSSD